MDTTTSIEDVPHNERHDSIMYLGLEVACVSKGNPPGSTRKWDQEFDLEVQRAVFRFLPMVLEVGLVPSLGPHSSTTIHIYRGAVTHLALKFVEIAAIVLS